MPSWRKRRDTLAIHVEGSPNRVRGKSIVYIEIVDMAFELRQFRAVRVGSVFPVSHLTPTL